MEGGDFLATLATAALLFISWDLHDIKQRMKQGEHEVAPRKAKQPFRGRGHECQEVTQPLPKVSQRDSGRD